MWMPKGQTWHRQHHHCTSDSDHYCGCNVEWVRTKWTWGFLTGSAGEGAVSGLWPLLNSPAVSRESGGGEGSLMAKPYSSAQRRACAWGRPPAAVLSITQILVRGICQRKPVGGEGFSGGIIWEVYVSQMGKQTRDQRIPLLKPTTVAWRYAAFYWDGQWFFY